MRALQSRHRGSQKQEESFSRKVLDLVLAVMDEWYFGQSKLMARGFLVVEVFIFSDRHKSRHFSEPVEAVLMESGRHLFVTCLLLCHLYFIFLALPSPFKNRHELVSFSGNDKTRILL